MNVQCNWYTKCIGHDSLDLSEQPETQSPSLCNTSDESEADEQAEEREDDNAFPPPANVNTLKNGQFMSAVDAWKAILYRSSSRCVFLCCLCYLQETKHWTCCLLVHLQKHNQDYLTTDNFRVVLRRDDQFCLKVRQSGKCIYRPTIPQHDISEIVTMHRYQTFLKEDNNFKKHVTWFTSTSDETLLTVALFEYSGTLRYYRTVNTFPTLSNFQAELIISAENDSK
jgi:hypothetical protein